MSMSFSWIESDVLGYSAENGSPGLKCLFRALFFTVCSILVPKAYISLIIAVDKFPLMYNALQIQASPSVNTLNPISQIQSIPAPTPTPPSTPSNLPLLNLKREFQPDPPVTDAQNNISNDAFIKLPPPSLSPLVQRKSEYIGMPELQLRFSN